MRWSFAENSLRRFFPQGTCPTRTCSLPQLFPIVSWRRLRDRVLTFAQDSRGAFLQHLFHASRCFLKQRRNNFGLRQILPITLWHFFLHRPRFHPGRVENVGVVGAPEFFHRVLGRRFGLRHTGGERKVSTIPLNATVRRQNRP